MSITRGVVTLVVLGALGLAVPTAGADDRQGRDRRGAGRQGGDRPRTTEMRSAPRGEARQAAPRGPSVRNERPRETYGGAGRVAGPRSAAPYRNEGHNDPYRAARPYYGNRTPYDNRSYDRDRRSYAVPRPYYSYSRPRSYYPRSYASRGYYGRIYAPRVYFPRAWYTRPYYVFRPRVSIGFGLWAGYPVTYGYAAYGYPAYGYPSYYPYPLTYGYPATSYVPDRSYATTPMTPVYPSSDYASSGTPETSVTAEAREDVGGVSFEITPMDAAVYVDGEYAGVVSNFTPRTQPLALAPGPHRIEVRAPGYETAVFELDVVAGEVTPYHGQLAPVR